VRARATTLFSIFSNLALTLTLLNFFLYSFPG